MENERNTDSALGPGSQVKKPKKKMNPVLKKRKIQEWVRICVQILFFFTAPSVYASAFTGIKNVFVSIGNGNPLQMSAFLVQLFIVCGFTMLFGRYFCGWACAFGAVGDWIYKFSSFIQKKIKKKLPRLPEKAVPVLQKLKYAVLVGILALSFTGNNTLSAKYGPWTPFSMIISGRFDVFTSGNYTVALVLLAVIIVGMAFRERFFCQFLCPMGAVFSLLPNLPLLGLKRNSDACPKNCGACKKNCPVNVMIDDGSLRQGECIRCGKCSGICPRGNLSSFFGKLKGNELIPDLLRGAVLMAILVLM